MDANDLLMGGGVASAKFPDIGASVSGRLVRAPETRQQTDLTTGDPKTFANGDPMWQIVVQLQTTERDPQITDDDGVRGVYIKGNMLGAVRDAVRRSGAKGLEVGGTLTVTYAGDGEPKKRGFNAPKLYTASYAPPSAQAANDMLMGNAAPASLVTEPAPPGIDPTMWSRMDADQRAKVLAAVGAAPPF